MSKTRHVGQRMLACVIAAFVAVGVALTAVAPTTAYADEAAIREVGEGVFKFNWRYDGENYSRGSCFLINEDHVLTCWHCCMFSPAERKALELAGVDVRDLVKKFTYTVTIYRDVQKEAKLVNFSEEEDWAIFKLTEKVGDSHALAFRDSQDVQAAETVWAVGFPANSDLKVINTYRPDDVTIKQGTVSKPEGTYAGEVEDGWVYRGNYLQTTAPLSGGDSGGPMVDDDGYVLGLSEMGIDNYYFCIANNSIMKALDRLGIAYDKKGGTVKPGDDTKGESGKTDGTANISLNTEDVEKAISDAEGKTENASAYTEDSYNAMKAALSEARDAAKLKLDNPEDGDELKEKQETIDKATDKLRGTIDGLQQKPEEEAGFKFTPGVIAAIVAGIAALIAAIAGIMALVKRNKKKAEAGTAPAQPGYNASVSTPTPVPAAAPKKAAAGTPVPVPAPAPAPVTDAPQTTVFDEDTPQTTVFDDDAPQTSVLTESVNGGVLTRMSTNEKIEINRSELTLGRDRKSVDYYLEGNTNIGRIHARILVRNGRVYILDNNSVNGTYVNNTKVRPGVEQELKSGDIVRLADEKFRYDSK